jgi:hypothetical protein
MRRVRRWLLITVPLAGPLAIALWLSTGRAHPITKANFERINYGMTRAEVDAILGKKFVQGEGMAGSIGWTTSWVYYSERDPMSLVPANTIVITFDNGIVTVKQFQPWTHADLMTRLRYRLGL